MILAFKSDVGRVRKENQDCCVAFSVQDAVFAVMADGMGGYNGGRTASEIAVKCAEKMIKQGYEPDMSESVLISMLNSCYVAANAEILERSMKDAELSGMGTTLVLVAIRKNRAVILNVGDSRAYFISNDEVKKITKDQSYVQYLVDKGEISASEAQTHPQKNVIMQAVGVSTAVAPDVYEIDYCGEMVLLCSDGLSNKVSDEDIAAVLYENIEPQTKIDKLIKMANDAGGEDNISVVLALCD